MRQREGVLDHDFTTLNDWAMYPHPVAASSALAPVLTGPPRRIEVVAAAPSAIYFSTEDPDCPAICVAMSTAVRVPCAVVLPQGVALPPLHAGTPGIVGAGKLSAGALSVRVARWWRPCRPRLRGHIPAAPPEVDALLGAGPGLTPYGDDVLAGALVTLAALDARLPDFTERVLTRAFERTTFVSAALLVHAARGECVPQLAAVLTALGNGAPLDLPLAALRGVGHTSGAGLLDGVRIILPAVLPG
jgi:hypothetical protein